MDIDDTDIDDNGNASSGNAEEMNPSPAVPDAGSVPEGPAADDPQAVDNVTAGEDEAAPPVDPAHAAEQVSSGAGQADAPAEETAGDDAAEETGGDETAEGTAGGDAAEEDSDEESAVAISDDPSMKWCVLRVASNREDTVCDALRKKVSLDELQDKIGGILVPTEKRRVGRGHSASGKGGRKEVNKKLYPGYIFIQLRLEEDGSVAEDAWFAIKDTPGVGNFIGSTGKPVPMSQDDVDKMLQQVEKAKVGEPISVEFSKGDQVKIKEGAFENFEGVVDEILPDKGLVRVVTTIFGRSTPVELEFWQIEKT